MGKSRVLIAILFLLVTVHLGGRDIDVAPGEWVPRLFVITPAAEQPKEEKVDFELDRSLYLLLVYDDIINATYQENLQRAAMLGLEEPADTLLALQDQLLFSYGLQRLDGPSEIEPREEFSQLEILRAHTVASKGSEQQAILLAGNVELRLRTDSEHERMVLTGETLLYDRERQLVIGVGTIELTDYSAEVERYLEGTGFYLSLESNDLLLAQGITEFIWSSKESEELKFFAQGERFFVPGDKSHLAVEKGVLSLQRELPHSSITASRLNFIEGGDLWAKDVVISVGRVPLIYLPWLYYPGQRFIFNPAFGYESTRGLFFATTTELYGQYPLIERQEQPSFATILTALSGEQSERGAWTYQLADAELSSLEQWARQNSSYLALLVDSYQYDGTFVGLDTLNSFNSGQHELAFFGGIALPGSRKVTASLYQIPDVRYFVEPSYGYKSKNFTLSLRLPMHSDPLVKRDFANRLTDFSLLGEQHFPTTYQRTQQSINWELSANGRIDVKPLAPYIDTLQLSKLLLQAQWRAKRSNVGVGYQLEKLVLPEMQVRLGGVLFQFRGSSQSASSKVSKETHFTPENHLVQYQLSSPYQVTPPSITWGSTRRFASELSLRYNVQSFLSYSFQALHTDTPTNSLYSKVQSSVTLRSAIGPNWLDVQSQFSPVLTFDENEKSTSGTLRVGYQQQTELVKLGFKHSINLRLYSYDFVAHSADKPAWNRSDILSHTLRWSYPIKINTLLIEPVIESILPPRELLLRPELRLSQGPITFAISHSFVQTEGNFHADSFKLSLSYQEKRRFVGELNATYQTSLAHTANRFDLQPLSLKSRAELYLFGANFSVAQSVSYLGRTNEFDALVTTLTLFNSTLQFSAKTINLALVPQALDLKLSSSRLEWRWWKNRISLFIDSSLRINTSFVDKGLNTLAFSGKLGFEIAEFLELNVELTSVNKAFGHYADFSAMWEDFWRSFDFFGPGRLQTYFDMEKVSLELIHFMPEWDLHCKYEGSVVLSDREWLWRPSFTIFLQWKAIPEIKFDSRF